MHRKYGSKLSLYIYKPNMKASAKHDCVHAPHDTQMKLKVFRSSTLALNQIDVLEIHFDSPELLMLFRVNSRHCLKIFANLTIVTCSKKLRLISLYVTRAVFLTAVNHSVRNTHAVQKRKEFFGSRVSSCMLIKYRCVCIQSFSVYFSINTTSSDEDQA